VSRWTLTPDRASEAADILVRAFAPNDPLREFLAPDPDERERLSAMMFQRSIAGGLSSGRVDAWGDPIVGIAIWLPRPAMADDETPKAAVSSAYQEFGPEVVERVTRVRAVVDRLRAIARPDRHAYLDEIGILPEHQRKGIATALLEAGHAWADAQSLPCALEAEVDANIAFYRGRGYEVLAIERVPDSNLVFTAMRRATQ
jgi:ribosomal protein S18 acetylase RimI-like enzyme